MTPTGECNVRWNVETEGTIAAIERRRVELKEQVTAVRAAISDVSREPRPSADNKDAWAYRKARLEKLWALRAKLESALAHTKQERRDALKANGIDPEYFFMRAARGVLTPEQYDSVWAETNRLIAQQQARTAPPGAAMPPANAQFVRGDTKREDPQNAARRKQNATSKLRALGFTPARRSA